MDMVTPVRSSGSSFSFLVFCFLCRDLFPNIFPPLDPLLQKYNNFVSLFKKATFFFFGFANPFHETFRSVVCRLVVICEVLLTAWDVLRARNGQWVFRNFPGNLVLPWCLSTSSVLQVLLFYGIIFGKNLKIFEIMETNTHKHTDIYISCICNFCP